MERLTLPSTYLFNERVEHVQKILRPLVDGKIVHCQFVPGALGNNSQVISSQSRQGKKPDNYHDWRFPTKAAPRVWFHYSEIWTLTNLGRHCSLNRAYLHLGSSGVPGGCSRRFIVSYLISVTCVRQTEWPAFRHKSLLKSNLRRITQHQPPGKAARVFQITMPLRTESARHPL